MPGVLAGPPSTAGVVPADATGALGGVPTSPAEPHQGVLPGQPREGLPGHGRPEAEGVGDAPGGDTRTGARVPQDEVVQRAAAGSASDDVALIPGPDGDVDAQGGV